MNSLSISLIVLAASAAVSFFYGLITRNYSTVDRLWSILPPVYMLIWLSDFYSSPRFIITFVLVLLWGIRLTTNFAVKGGYSFSFSRGFTGEDYRWEVMRAKIPNRFLFELFNLFFISAFQLGLIFIFTLPLYYYGQTEGAITGPELILFIIHFLLLCTELYADVLQLRFYRRRYKKPWSSQRRYRLGFNTFGIWKYSRHPNYVCEISQWIIVSLYLTFSAGRLHFSSIGAALLFILFIGSTILAESITESKYPDYTEWKKLTSAWIPLKSFFRNKKKKGFLAEKQTL